MPSFALGLTVALLRHYLTQAIGSEALDLVISQLAELGGEEAKAKLQALHDASLIEREELLVSAARETEECFQRECADPTLRSALQALPLVGTESLQSALAMLPNSFDESALNQVITNLFASAWPNLSETQHVEAVKVYLSCLRRALLKIKDYSSKIIPWAVLRTDERTEIIEARTKQIVEMVRIQKENTERVDELLRNKLGITHEIGVGDILFLEDEPPLPPKALAPRTRANSGIVYGTP